MRRTLLSIAALAGLIPAPAGAALDTPEDAIRALYAYSGCVVHHDSAASSILGVPPGSEAERAILQKIATPGCNNGGGSAYRLVFEPQMLRGAIAEDVLYHGDGGRINGRTIRWVAPFTVISQADIDALDDRGRAALQALDFAQCILADAPEAVAALLDTRPTTEPEQRAVQQLAPYLGPCLEAGAQMAISRPQLRGFLAEASYRKAYVASHAVAGAGRD